MATIEVNSIFQTKAANGDLREHYLATKTALIKDAGQPNGVATLNAQGALSQMPTLTQVGGSNKNFIHNGHFKAAMNQRSVSGILTPGNSAIFFYDRWQTARTTLTLGASGVSLAWDGTNSVNGYILQKIEGTLLFGKPVTISVEIDGVVYFGTVTVPTVANAASAYVNLVGNIHIYATNWGNTFWSITIQTTSTTPVLITRVKVEEGVFSTLINETPPEPRLEIQACRYFFELFESYSYARFAQGIAYDATTAHFCLEISPKRSVPTIQWLVGNVTKLYINQGATYLPLTALDITDVRANHVFLRATVASGLTPNANYTLRGGGDTVKFALVAEL